MAKARDAVKADAGKENRQFRGKGTKRETGLARRAKESEAAAVVAAARGSGEWDLGGNKAASFPILSGGNRK